MEIFSKFMGFKEASSRVLTDDHYSCTYQQALNLLSDILKHFNSCKIFADNSCLALMCDNSLATAILILFLLKEGYSFFPIGKDINTLDKDPNEELVPKFCSHIVTIESPYNIDNSFGANFCDKFLSIIENKSCYPENILEDGAQRLYLRTSGSTGAQKVVKHSLSSVVGNALNCIERLEITSNDKVSIPVPIFHSYGLTTAFLPSVMAGASVNLQKGANALTYLKQENTFEPNVSFMTPSFCKSLMKVKKSGKPYRLIIVAGDKLDEGAFLEAESYFHCVVNLYGSTEMGAIASSIPKDPIEIRSKTVGKLMPGVRLEIRNSIGSDSSKKEDSKRIGEIWCQHKYSFEGYVDEKGNLRSPLENNLEWFNTKDLGRFISNDYLEILGRSDQNIKRDGLFISLLNIEEIIKKIEGIRNVLVLAGKETIRGKEIIAYCVLSEEFKGTDLNIREICFTLLPGRLVPDRIFIVDSFPTLSSGKIDRKRLVYMSLSDEAL